MTDKTSEPNTTHYLMKDRLGSIINILDSNENLKTTYSYDAFGEPTATYHSGQVDCTYRFTGRAYDTAMGNYFYRARYYNQSLGRFFSRDPIFSLQSIYSYCANSPTNYTDPSGLRAGDSSDGALMGMVIGPFWPPGLPPGAPCVAKKGKMVKVKKGEGDYSKDEDGNFVEDPDGDYKLVVYDSDDGFFSDGREWNEDEDGGERMSLWGDMEGQSTIIGYVSWNGRPMTRGAGDMALGVSLWQGEFNFFVGQLCSAVYQVANHLDGLTRYPGAGPGPTFDDPLGFLRGSGLHPDEAFDGFDGRPPIADIDPPDPGLFRGIVSRIPEM